MGHHHGRHCGRYGAADLACADLPEPHHFGPDGRRSKGLAVATNLLFITCHDLGQHLGCYGQSSVTSPALDRLAAGGVRFARSFCTAPQCSPSRASLHTGMYPHSAGVLGLAHPPYGWRLAPDVPHTAQILAAAGYSTTLVGMQHLIDRGSARELGYQDVLPVAPAYEEADASVEVLRQLTASDRPFYLEVGFEEPHRPYAFGGAEPDLSHGVSIPGYLPDAPESRQDLAAFQGAIRQMDAGVGRILAGLDDLGIADSTLVVFATDHGAAMPRAK
ncbi:MAG: sulfatase-like hydrolase/transferase, partial [Mycobacterium sp.]|nr:sulfatase-like hydrolase/transferase [Mycobacterium sp.]